MKLKAKPISFDGFTFNYSPQENKNLPWLLYLCYHARRGDGAAAEILTASLQWQGGTIIDIEGRQYWPPTDADPVQDIGLLAIPTSGRHLLVFNGFSTAQVEEMMDGLSAWYESGQPIGVLHLPQPDRFLRLVRVDDPVVGGLDPIWRGAYMLAEGELCKVCEMPITKNQINDVVLIDYTGDAQGAIPVHGGCWVNHISVGNWQFKTPQEFEYIPEEDRRGDWDVFRLKEGGENAKQ